ncbi:MAG: SPFH domain-containing protein [Lachnospiraceae bacterium]|nr:SPFH domain-containing protein [Lachnospiraceae bacterium]
MAQIAEIIKYEGDNSTFIWKHPSEDFNSMTQLIVHESQEAIFFMNGQALDTFGPGRYTLETQNIPKIGKFLNRVTGGETPFHCEVYFINQTVQMGLKWGTDSKVRYLDPDSGIPLEIGASGEMNMRVIDGRKLLVKLVGTMNGIAWEQNGSNFTKSLQASFRPLISMAVKSNLSAAIKDKNVNILEVDEHLTEISEVLKSKICPGFEEYGLTIPEFFLTTVVLPEENPNFKRLKELQTVLLQTRMARAEATVKTAEAQAEAEITAARRQVEMERQTTATEVAKKEAERKVIGAEAEAEAARRTGFAEAEVMHAKGYNQKDVLEAEVQKAYAEGIGNMGSGSGNGGGTSGGGIASDMVSMMAGMKMAGVMMDKMDGLNIGGKKETANETPAVQKEETIQCPKCGATLPSKAKFCLECGAKVEVLSENEIICPVCGKKTPKGKFCMECGAPLVRKCPNCGAELPTGAKFCLECGTKTE